jgi:hypothetical protein
VYVRWCNIAAYDENTLSLQFNVNIRVNYKYKKC